MTKNWKQFKPDGGYGNSNYLVQDANALLQEVAGHLLQYGVTESEIIILPKRRLGEMLDGIVIAVGKFWSPDNLNVMVRCEIGKDDVLDGRKDLLMILASQQVRVIETPKRSELGWQAFYTGPKQWIDPAHNSLELAARLLEIAKMEQDITDLLPKAYYSRTLDKIAFPEFAGETSTQASINFNTQNEFLTLCAKHDALLHAGKPSSLPSRDEVRRKVMKEDFPTVSDLQNLCAEYIKNKYEGVFPAGATLKIGEAFEVDFWQEEGVQRATIYGIYEHDEGGEDITNYGITIILSEPATNTD